MLTWDDYNNEEALNATPPAPVVDIAVETLAEPAPAAYAAGSSLGNES